MAVPRNAAVKSMPENIAAGDRVAACAEMDAAYVRHAAATHTVLNRCRNRGI
jgi:hypothetical protein